MFVMSPPSVLPLWHIIDMYCCFPKISIFSGRDCYKINSALTPDGGLINGVGYLSIGLIMLSTAQTSYSVLFPSHKPEMSVNVTDS